jgi:hypothetical protein
MRSLKGRGRRNLIIYLLYQVKKRVGARIASYLD